MNSTIKLSHKFSSVKFSASFNVSLLNFLIDRSVSICGTSIFRWYWLVMQVIMTANQKQQYRCVLLCSTLDFVEKFSLTEFLYHLKTLFIKGYGAIWSSPTITHENFDTLRSSIEYLELILQAERPNAYEFHHLKMSYFI